MRILVFSDVHVGQGLGNGRTPADRLGDFDDTLYNVAKLAVDRRVDAVIFGGDLYEGPVPRSSYYRLVHRALVAPLAEAGIPIVGVSGNSRHDSAGNEGEDNALAVHHRPGVFDVYTRAALHVLPGLVVACVPWASPARLRAMLNGSVDVEDADAMAARLVIRLCEDLRAQARAEHPDLPCALLSHFATTGWKTPTGLPTDEIRDVVLPLDELERLGFDAVFMGHVHAPGVINGALAGPDQDDDGATARRQRTVYAGEASATDIVSGPANAPIISLGSPLCLSFGEEHVDHGVWVAEFAPRMRREAPDVEFVALAGRRFVTLDLWAPHLDVPRDPDPGERELIADAIVRVRYEATPEQARLIDQAALTRALLDAGAHTVRVDATVLREARARVEGLTETVAPLDALESWLGSQNGAVSDDVAAGLRDWTRDALAEVTA